MRNDVVRCAPGDRIADVLEAIDRSPYSFALVTDEAGTLLGRVRAGHDGDAQARAGEVMELDPSTVRPHRSAGGLAQQLAEREVEWAIVTTPEGRLLGVASRADLEHAG